MKDSLVLSTKFTMDPDLIDENTTVILGFSGFGSVGRLTVNHIIETFKSESIGFWGTASWFHNGQIESPITIYQLKLKSKDPKEKFILVSSRLNIPVVGYGSLPDLFWKFMTKEILSWGAKRYIGIGGLREEIRNSSDDAWVALIPTREYSKIYGTRRTFKEHLSIQGPISYLLMESTAFNIPTLIILSYCNTYDSDIEAAQIALKELETHMNVDLKSKSLNLFDSSFLNPDTMSFWDGEEYDEFYEGSDDDLYEEYDEEDNYRNNSKKGNFDVINFDAYKEFFKKSDDLDEYK